VNNKISSSFLTSNNAQLLEICRILTGTENWHQSCNQQAVSADALQLQSEKYRLQSTFSKPDVIISCTFRDMWTTAHTSPHCHQRMTITNE